MRGVIGVVLHAGTPLRRVVHGAEECRGDALRGGDLDALRDRTPFQQRLFRVVERS